MQVFSLSTFLVLTICSQSLGQQSYQPKITLYAGMNCQGPSFPITGAYLPDMSVYNWDNVARSAKVTGSWLLYDEAFYNPSLNGAIEPLVGYNNDCISSFNYVPGLVSSVRFAGDHLDYRNDSLTLYEGIHYQGQEEFTFNSLPSMALLNHSSLILTGSTGWRLFDGPNYSGVSLCVGPSASNNLVSFVYDTVNIQIPHGTIRSVKKGC